MRWPWSHHARDLELRQLARDIHAGLVFTSQHIKNWDEDGLSVFPSLGMLDDSAAHRLEHQGMFYEYLDKAMPVGVNGMPMFDTAQTLTKQEAEKVWEYLDEME